MKTRDERLTLITPARNEAVTIGRVLAEFDEAASAHRLILDKFVIDDGSTDQTAAIATQAGATVIRASGSGLAAAFRQAVLHVSELPNEWILHIDADGQHPANELHSLLGARTEGDLILGSRLHRQPNGMSQLRYQTNKTLSAIVSAMCSTDVPDSQTGFRLFSKRVALSVNITSTFTYTQEQIIRAAFAGCRVVAVPISIRARLSGRSRLVSSSLEYLARVFSDLHRIANELHLTVEESPQP